MNQKKLLFLIALTTIMMFFTMLLNIQKEKPVSSGNEQLDSQLANQLDSVEQIKIISGNINNETILKKDDYGWVVETKYSYPAKEKEINELLVKLSQAKKLIEKTSNPDLYDHLGVQSIGKSGSRLIELFAGGKKIQELYIGHIADGGMKGTYVRKASNAESWLVSEQIDFPVTANEWLNKKIFDLHQNDITKVMMTVNNDHHIEIGRDETGLTIKNSLNINLDQMQAEHLVETISQLEFEDVNLAKKSSFKNESIYIEVFLKNGEVFKLELSDESNQLLVRLNAYYADESTIPPNHISELISNYNALWSNWSYSLSENTSKVIYSVLNTR